VNDRIVAAEAGMLARESRNPLATFNLGEAKKARRPSAGSRTANRTAARTVVHRSPSRVRGLLPRARPYCHLRSAKGCCHFGLCKPQAALLYAGRTACLPVPR
jgi:hypothetical protein